MASFIKVLKQRCRVNLSSTELMAFDMHDISTVIPFEVLVTEKGFGIMLELLNAKVLSTFMHDNPNDFEKSVIEMAKFAKTLADTEFEDGLLKNHNDILTDVVESAAEYLTLEEISLLKSYHILKTSLTDNSESKEYL